MSDYGTEITDKNNGTAKVNFIETKNGKLEFAERGLT